MIGKTSALVGVGAGEYHEGVLSNETKQCVHLQILSFAVGNASDIKKCSYYTGVLDIIVGIIQYNKHDVCMVRYDKRNFFDLGDETGRTM